MLHAVITGNSCHLHVRRAPTSCYSHSSICQPRRGLEVVQAGVAKTLKLLHKSTERSKGTNMQARNLAANATGGDQSSARTLRVYYGDPDRNLQEAQSWSLAVEVEGLQSQEAFFAPTGVDDVGLLYWDVSLHNLEPPFSLRVQNRDAATKPITHELNAMNGATEVWLIANDPAVYSERPKYAAAPAPGTLALQSAHWVSKSTILWRTPAKDASGAHCKFYLHHSQTAGIKCTGQGPQGADGMVELQVAPSQSLGNVVGKYPHLSGCLVLSLPPNTALAPLLTAQLALATHAADGTPQDVTGVQVAGVLDELYPYDGPLGACKTESGVAFHVWAPTAQQVELMLFDGPRGGHAEVVALKAAHGVWSYEGSADLMWRYYQYRVTVYCPWSQRVEAVEATDPYSCGLAADGQRSQAVDLDHPSTKPPGWDAHRAPPLASFSDISLYELHIRDFSVHDDKVPLQLRGKCLAFAEKESHGVQHLQQLQQAGLTHVHLLPSYDYGSVPEREEDQLTLKDDLSQYAADSSQQQEAVLAIADADAFNWGYDPVHWGVPEGSYATDPDGPARIREYRHMVQALHLLGLRVIQDHVYNHTFAAGPESKYSVLDKVVPGYYHRREENGVMLHTTCCNNTASEHAMCERLIIDDILHWATNYKTDGSRQDIMGHLMVSTMTKMQAKLAGLTLEKDGVDGSSFYIYGEAWDFGEVANNQRGRNASQLNIGGTGLGSFNDRIRDALMGGSPFAPSRYQGFGNGLALQSNSFMSSEMATDAQLKLLLETSDVLRLSIAGNLKQLVLETADGAHVAGQQLMYGPHPAGYAAEPAETINYASCHDGQILFDQLIMKAAEEVTIEERCRMQQLAMAVIAFSQGIPFFHAGDEVLRSKSLDRDSYNSGDWFNKLDFTGRSHNFGVGLPVATKNEDQWPIMKPLLARTDLKPSTKHILAAREFFMELLTIRYSSALFRLTSAAHICSQLRFHNTGPQQVPGIIAVEVQSSKSAAADGTYDPSFKRILIVLNARPDAQTLQLWPEGAQQLELHPVQQGSIDAATQSCSCDSQQRVISVARQTAAVFVERRT